MPASSPVANDDPLMIAWVNYKNSKEFENTLTWLKKGFYTGETWAIFAAGYSAHKALSTTAIPVVHISRLGKWVRLISKIFINKQGYLRRPFSKRSII